MAFYIQIGTGGLVFPDWEEHKPFFYLLFTSHKLSETVWSHGSSLLREPTFFFFFFWETVSLHSSGWLRTSHVFQAGLKFWDLPLSASQGPGLKAGTTMPGKQLLRGFRLNTTLGNFLQRESAWFTVFQSLSLVCKWRLIYLCWEGVEHCHHSDWSQSEVKALQSRARCYHLFPPMLLKWQRLG